MYQLDIKIFITLFLSVFASTMGMGLVAPLLPVYAHELGAGAFQVGLIFGAFSLTRSVFLPYFGKMSDIRGRKPFITLGLLIYFLLSIVYVFSDTVRALVSVRLCQGFASAMILPVAQAYVGTITPKGREGLTMGLFNVALYGGLSIGPILGGVVKDRFSIHFSFLSMGVLTLFSFLLCLVMLPPERPRGRGKSSPDGGTGPAGYLRLLQNRAVLSLFLYRLCFTTGIGILWAFLPLYATTELRLSSSLIGILLTVNVLISGIFQTPMGYLADRFGKKLPITGGGVLAALSIYHLTGAGSFGELLGANVLFGLAGGISFPAVMALSVIEGRRTRAMGSVMGLLALAHSLGMLAGPLMAGILVDLYSFGAIRIFGPLVLVTGILFSMGIPASDREETEDGAGVKFDIPEGKKHTT